MNNIKDYKNYEFLFRLKKSHSPIYVDFFNENSDGWFIIVATYTNKSGKINDSYTIIKKDLENHLNFYKNSGFIKEK